MCHCQTVYILGTCELVDYWLMEVDTIVSADLAGIGNASGHPVK